MWISSHGSRSRFLGSVIQWLQIIAEASCVDGISSHPRAVQESPRPSWTDYSALVVFGDSYSDNGHPRSPEDQLSLAPKPAVGGRFSDGPVWNEYLAQKLSELAASNITFLNYAYNGAYIDNTLNKLPVKPVPDTAAQIQTYLTDLRKYAQHPVSGKIFGGRVLHALWIGINPIITIWRSAICGNQSLDTNAFLTPKLVKALDTQVEAFRQQLTQLLSNSSLSKCQTDYMIMTIPPLTNTVLALNESSREAKGNATLARQYGQLLGRLTDHFNEQLVGTMQELKRKSSGNKSRIAVFDAVKFWSDVRSTPRKFGIQYLSACHPDMTKSPCKNPDMYMYWDLLHPSSILHNNLSNAIMQFLGDLDQ
ncbi:hypothetical protein PGT21_024540 [Puccinia graminis f. sp. tritici]|uniref:SGNH hydrolase-type esterase domain-containing protein n=1 Tax=Puccinia graminis f. sp. tritici TaxID=56615 RepID=A0A5B0N9C3_PUCGR|nr:hypothetical protein PGT21_024540 [Puccinia graminis f. sp. tritici]KAA1113767.1 hypothetical protein PGTUg99_017868 [Puccinia graminis f. sp. tritici]